MEIDTSKKCFVNNNTMVNTCVLGDLGKGKTFMSTWEACDRASKGDKVILFLNGGSHVVDFFSLVSNCNYNYSWRVDVWYPGAGFWPPTTLADRLIFDDSFQVFPVSWKEYSCRISVYTSSNDVYSYFRTDDPYSKFNLNYLSNSKGSVSVDRSCPKCGKDLKKMTNSGLFYSGPIEVMKCSNCGYCN